MRGSPAQPFLEPCIFRALAPVPSHPKSKSSALDPVPSHIRSQSQVRRCISLKKNAAWKAVFPKNSAASPNNGADAMPFFIKNEQIPRQMCSEFWHATKKGTLQFDWRPTIGLERFSLFSELNNEKFEQNKENSQLT